MIIEFRGYFDGGFFCLLPTFVLASAECDCDEDHGVALVFTWLGLFAGVSLTKRH